MANKTERIQRDADDKLMKKMLDREERFREEVSEAIATLYVAGMTAKIGVDVVKLVKNLLKEIEN